MKKIFIAFVCFVSLNLYVSSCANASLSEEIGQGLGKMARGALKTGVGLTYIAVMHPEVLYGAYTLIVGGVPDYVSVREVPEEATKYFSGLNHAAGWNCTGDTTGIPHFPSGNVNITTMKQLRQCLGYPGRFQDPDMISRQEDEHMFFKFLIPVNSRRFVAMEYIELGMAEVLRCFPGVCMAAVTTLGTLEMASGGVDIVSSITSYGFKKTWGLLKWGGSKALSFSFSGKNKQE